MIVVIGRTTGTAGPVARRIALRDRPVELVAPIRPDSVGDRVLAELATAGVHHAAVLRTGAVSLEGADVELALRYLPDVRVIVVADDAAATAPTAMEAAAWSSAPLIVVADPGDDPPEGQPTTEGGLTPPAVVLERPAADPDEAFAGLVAALAARLEAGDAVASAFHAVRRELALDPVRSSSGRPSRDPAKPDRT